MSESEATVEGLCDDHRYARQFIDVAHGRLKDFTVEDRLEVWHDYAWSDTTVICDTCVGVPPVVVTYDTTWTEIDEEDPEGPIFFLIKVQLGGDVAWGWLSNPDLYIHGVAIEIEEYFTTEEEVKAHHQKLEAYAAQAEAEQGRDEDE
jgi:hypothetical protein